MTDKYKYINIYWNSIDVTKILDVNNMNKNNVAQLIINNSKIKNTFILVLVCGALNVGTDMTVGLVPGVGDVANSLFDTFLLIVQLGSIAYLKSNGIEYTPNE